MRVLVAPDSFGGSLTAAEAAAAIATGWARGAPADDVDEVPLSDGGPGFVDALAGVLGGRLVDVAARDPWLRPVRAQILLDGSTAYVESAQACGLHLVEAEKRHPASETTSGLADLLSAAIDAGATKVVVGLGGSATNDGGAGLLNERGVQLRDARGGELSPFPSSLALLDHVELGPSWRPCCRARRRHRRRQPTSRPRRRDRRLRAPEGRPTGGRRSPRRRPRPAGGRGRPPGPRCGRAGAVSGRRRSRRPRLRPLGARRTPAERDRARACSDPPRRADIAGGSRHHRRGLLRQPVPAGQGGGRCGPHGGESRHRLHRAGRARSQRLRQASMSSRLRPPTRSPRKQAHRQPRSPSRDRTSPPSPSASPDPICGDPSAFPPSRAKIAPSYRRRGRRAAADLGREE